MPRAKTPLRLALEAMSVEETCVIERADITEYWRAQNTANLVRRTKGYIFHVVYDRPSKMVTVRRIK